MNKKAFEQALLQALEEDLQRDIFERFTKVALVHLMEQQGIKSFIVPRKVVDTITERHVAISLTFGKDRCEVSIQQTDMEPADPQFTDALAAMFNKGSKP